MCQTEAVYRLVGRKFVRYDISHYGYERVYRHVVMSRCYRDLILLHIPYNILGLKI